MPFTAVSSDLRPPNPKCLTAIIVFDISQQGMVSAQFWRKNTAFCVYSVHVKSWCAANSNLAYFIELTTAL